MKKKIRSVKCQVFPVQQETLDNSNYFLCVGEKTHTVTERHRNGDKLGERAEEAGLNRAVGESLSGSYH